MKCIDVGLKSATYDSNERTSTLVYCRTSYDENGVHHEHDVNRLWGSWYCSTSRRDEITWRES